MYTTDGERGAECSRTQPNAVLCKAREENAKQTGSRYYGGEVREATVRP